MAVVHHRYATVHSRKLFYREAGCPTSPTIVLLHGFPATSHMFRHLIPLLAEDYHVIAPDHLGFGLSDAPRAGRFSYTFDVLAESTAKLLDVLAVPRYVLLVHGHGAPIGWRLALSRPRDVAAIISQNGNAYESGFHDGFWRTVWDYQESPSVYTEEALRGLLGADAIRAHYVTGVADESLVDPEAWRHDHALLSRPGHDQIQLALFRDYAATRRLYPALHEYFRMSNVPLLAVWGRGDAIFAPAGAEAFAADLPYAEIHLLEGGHFLLESALDDASALIAKFLDGLDRR
jgi:pimeloyl-ACP methyl ester carboxylesterase